MGIVKHRDEQAPAEVSLSPAKAATHRHRVRPTDVPAEQPDLETLIKQITLPFHARLRESNVALLERFIALGSRLSTGVAPEKAAEFLKMRDDVTMLTAVVRDPQALTEIAKPEAPDPLAAARDRGAQFRWRVLTGPETVSAEDAARELGLKSRQAVDVRRKKGKLLALPAGAGAYRYPLWQFDKGVALPGLEDTLAALSDAADWTKYRFFTTRSVTLRGRTPVDALRAGDIETVLKAARRFAAGEQGGS